MATRLQLTRLRNIRELCGMTQGQMSELSGLSLMHIYRLEKGRAPDIKMSSLEQIARAINFDLWQLVKQLSDVEG